MRRNVVLAVFVLILVYYLVWYKELKNWEEVKQKSTISEYESFIAKDPHSKFINEAHALNESLKKERLPAFRNAKRAKIIINERYGPAKLFSLNHAISMINMSLLKYAGIDVIVGKDDPSEYDFIVKIDINGKPLREDYRSLRLYTGATLEGTITFEAKDGSQISDSFSSKKEPPRMISVSKEFGNREIACRERPDGAPFWEIFTGWGSGWQPSNTYICKMIELEYKAFGSTPIILALKDARNSVYVAQHGTDDPCVNEGMTYVSLKEYLEHSLSSNPEMKLKKTLKQ